MLNLVRVAVTGGLSSGKSSVCRFFKELGAYVVSADEIVHQLLSSKNSLSKKVIDLLGEDILVEGRIDRSKIAEKVFSNNELLMKLENLLHPAVKEEMQKQYQIAQMTDTATLFVAEIPLLFETDGGKDYDHILCVVTSPETGATRFQSLTGYGKDEYLRRMSRQYNIEKKAANSDFIIYNNGSLTDLKADVISIYQQLNNSSRRIYS